MIGAIAGTMALHQFNNFLSQIRESQAANRQYRYGEMAANNADARARRLYMDFMSPSALRQQYQEAGLSPSLLFGGGGIGGQTPQGAQGTGSQQGAIYTPISPVDAAQIELMKAQANKANADADNTRNLSDATLEKIVAETENTRVKTAGQRLVNAMQEIQNYIADATKDNNVELNTYALLKADREFLILEEELQQEIAESKIKKETAETVIEEEKQKLINLEIQAKLMRSNIGLNNAQIKALAERLSMEHENIEINWNGLTFKQEQLDAQVQQWAIENKLEAAGIVGKIVGAIIGAAGKAMTHGK